MTETAIVTANCLFKALNPAHESPRDETRGQNERDADDRSRHLAHRRSVARAGTCLPRCDARPPRRRQFASSNHQPDASTSPNSDSVLIEEA